MSPGDLHFAFRGKLSKFSSETSVSWLFQEAENLKHINKKQLCSQGIAGKTPIVGKCDLMLFFTWTLGK
jgi:hypothetical protein